MCACVRACTQPYDLIKDLSRLPFFFISYINRFVILCSLCLIWLFSFKSCMHYETLSHFSITTDCPRFNVDDDILRNFSLGIHMRTRYNNVQVCHFFIIFLWIWCMNILLYTTPHHTTSHKYVSFNLIMYRDGFYANNNELNRAHHWVQPFPRMCEEHWKKNEK